MFQGSDTRAHQDRGTSLRPGRRETTAYARTSVQSRSRTPVAWRDSHRHPAHVQGLGMDNFEASSERRNVVRTPSLEDVPVPQSRPAAAGGSSRPATGCGPTSTWRRSAIRAPGTTTVKDAVTNSARPFWRHFGRSGRSCAVTTIGLYRSYDEKIVGGDINGGLQDWRQLIFRPVPGLDPYFTGLPGIYSCSSSTPRGGGVHGICRPPAARSALRREFGGRNIGGRKARGR